MEILIFLRHYYVHLNTSQKDNIELFKTNTWLQDCVPIILHVMSLLTGHLHLCDTKPHLGISHLGIHSISAAACDVCSFLKDSIFQIGRLSTVDLAEMTSEEVKSRVKAMLCFFCSSLVLIILTSRLLEALFFKTTSLIILTLIKLENPTRSS